MNKAPSSFPGHVHIDRIKVEGPLEHNPVGELFYKIDAHTGQIIPVGAEAYTPQRRKNPLPDDIYLKSTCTAQDGKAYRFVFECCPPQVLQGHNVFGISSPRAYAFELFCRQTAKWEFSPTEQEIEAWRSGKGVKLQLLHLTGNLRCSPGWKAAIFDAVDSNNRFGKKRERETSITLGLTNKGERSAHHMTTLYCKWCLLSQEWKTPGPLQTELLKTANRSLRAEVKLFSQWLRTYGVDDHGNILNISELRKKDPRAASELHPLQFVESWDYVDVDALFFKLLGNYRLETSIQRKLTGAEMRELSKGAKRAYLLRLGGADLNSVYSKSTISKYDEETQLKVGVSIRGRGRIEQLPEIDLRTVFCPEALMPVPESLRGTKRYWEPGSLYSAGLPVPRVSGEGHIPRSGAVSPSAIGDSHVLR